MESSAFRRSRSYLGPAVSVPVLRLLMFIMELYLAIPAGPSSAVASGSLTAV